MYHTLCADQYPAWQLQWFSGVQFSCTMDSCFNIIGLFELASEKLGRVGGANEQIGAIILWGLSWAGRPVGDVFMGGFG